MFRCKTRTIFLFIVSCCIVPTCCLYRTDRALLYAVASHIILKVLNYVIIKRDKKTELALCLFVLVCAPVHIWNNCNLFARHVRRCIILLFFLLMVKLSANVKAICANIILCVLNFYTYSNYVFWSGRRTKQICNFKQCVLRKLQM